MNDLEFMAIAAQTASLADKALTYENPRVGALIVKNNQILATGYHQKFGEEHAEINAYNHLSDKSQIEGATLYVTLEPCATHGKVESCARTMTSWGLKQVIIGSVDPNIETHGRGIKILQNTGISVSVLDTHHSSQLNPEFYQYFKNKSPYVQLKLAMSNNGFVSQSSNKRIKLTDDIADIDVHHERAMRSAVLIGSQTFLTDSPSLTVRHGMLAHRQPIRIVIDRTGRLQKNPSSFSEGWLVYTENKDFALNFDNVIFMKNGLQGVLSDLFNKNIQSVMVEGGPTLITAFLKENLWHEMIGYKTNVMLPKHSLAAALPVAPPTKQLAIGNAIKSIYINQNWRK